MHLKELTKLDGGVLKTRRKEKFLKMGESETG
jgi:hypothetical protein